MSLGDAAAQAQAGPRKAGPPPRVLLVTGMSGAGKTSALKALEDIGYEAVDNLPLGLLSALVNAEPGYERPLAIGVDVRTRDFGGGPLLQQIETLVARTDIEVRLIFFDCDDEVLQRRFSATRRRHPLAPDLPVSDGILVERRRLDKLRDRADPVIDTTDFTEADLRKVVRQLFTPGDGDIAGGGMAVSIISFSYGHGVPRQSDLVFDVRFLRNPHYDDALRPLTGEDPRVGAYVEGDPHFGTFFEGLTGLIGPLLPRYQAEGKSYLTIAIGCTGGRHRSVHVSEKLAGWLGDRGYRVALRHRQLGIDKFPAMV